MGQSWSWFQVSCSGLHINFLTHRSTFNLEFSWNGQLLLTSHEPRPKLDVLSWHWTSVGFLHLLSSSPQSWGLAGAQDQSAVKVVWVKSVWEKFFPHFPGICLTSLVGGDALWSWESSSEHVLLPEMSMTYDFFHLNTHLDFLRVLKYHQI